MPLALGLVLLGAEVLGVGGAVAVTAGLLLTTGFHTGVGSIRLHLHYLQNWIYGGSARTRTEVSWIMSPALSTAEVRNHVDGLGYVTG